MRSRFLVARLLKDTRGVSARARPAAKSWSVLAPFRHPSLSGLTCGFRIPRYLGRKDNSTTALDLSLNQ